MINVITNADRAWVANECVVYGGDLYVLKDDIWRLIPIKDYVTTVAIQFDKEEWLSIHTKQGVRYKIYKYMDYVRVVKPGGESEDHYFRTLFMPYQDVKEILNENYRKHAVKIDHKDFVLLDGKLYVYINREWVYIHYPSDFVKAYVSEKDFHSIIVETSYDCMYNLAFEKAGIRWTIADRRPEVTPLVTGFDKYGKLFERSRRDAQLLKEPSRALAFLNTYSGREFGRQDISKGSGENE